MSECRRAGDRRSNLIKLTPRALKTTVRRSAADSTLHPLHVVHHASASAVVSAACRFPTLRLALQHTPKRWRASHSCRSSHQAATRPRSRERHRLARNMRRRETTPFTAGIKFCETLFSQIDTGGCMQTQGVEGGGAGNSWPIVQAGCCIASPAFNMLRTRTVDQMVPVTRTLFLKPGRSGQAARKK